MKWTLWSEYKTPSSLQPPSLESMFWTVGLIGIWGITGWLLRAAQTPSTVMIGLILGVLALTWLKTYGWISDMQQTIADWLMVIVGLLGALLGSLIDFLLDPHSESLWTDNLELIGILPITGAFRGTLSVLGWSHSLAQLKPRAWLLRGLAPLILTSAAINLGAIWITREFEFQAFVQQGIWVLSAALPIMVYFYFAYEFLPQVLTEQFSQNFNPWMRSISGLDPARSSSQITLEAQVEAIADEQGINPSAALATPFTEAPTEAQASHPTGADPEAKTTPVFDLKDWADTNADKIRQGLSLGAGCLLIPFLLASLGYWIISWGIGHLVIASVQLISGAVILPTWGVNWLQGWLFTWIVTLAVAIQQVFQDPMRWTSLFFTVSLLGSALLIPTALVWSSFQAISTAISMTWSLVLGTLLVQSDLKLKQSLPLQPTFLTLVTASWLGLGLGWILNL